MKTLKKLSFVLAVLLALGCVAPMTAMAEVPYPDTIGYSEANINKLTIPPLTAENDLGQMTQAPATPSGTYYVANKKGLDNLSAFVIAGTTFEGCTIVQTADIDMSLKGADTTTWTPIGFVSPSAWNSKPFKGTYDGQGHTISNMTFTLAEVPTANTSLGLLFSCANSATLLNIVMDNTCSVSYTGAGGSPEIYVAAILGRIGATVTITNCYTAATVRNTNTQGNSAAGGIVANLASSATIKYCTNAGTITGVRRVGGIVAYIMNVMATVSNCCNIGNITSTGSTNDAINAVGGICGGPNTNSSNQTHFTYCTNYGTITGSAANTFVGGILGMVRATTYASNNTDYGTVESATSNPETIFGHVYSTESTANVDATNKVLRDADKAMFHGYQVRANGENAVDLRLVASIDGKSYSAVGMKVTVTFTYNGNPVTKVLDNEAGSKTTTVYETLTAYANDTNVDYTADALRIDEKSGYLYAVVLTGIPKAAFDSGDFTVTVTPYATDLENAETEYMGVQAVKVITLDPLPDNTVPEN